MITIEAMIYAIMAQKELRQNSRESVEDFVNTMVKTNRVIIEKDAFAFYVNVDDETLDEIAKEPGYITKPKNIIKMLNGTGDNVHFFGIISIKTGGSALPTILKGLKDTITKEKPKSISWWNPTMDRFIRRAI